MVIVIQVTVNEDIYTRSLRWIFCCLYPLAKHILVPGIMDVDPEPQKDHSDTEKTDTPPPSIAGDHSPPASDGGSQSGGSSSSNTIMMDIDSAESQRDDSDTKNTDSGADAIPPPSTSVHSPTVAAGGVNMGNGSQSRGGSSPSKTNPQVSTVVAYLFTEHNHQSNYEKNMYKEDLTAYFNYPEMGRNCCLQQYNSFYII